ncbi:[protein-PII] uridylyltransferase [Desulfovibrio sulfodismutans]|uniref:Bifunctional uridylyltransferase/uridylyl-removing enzyme n=1 Tax=Desulfolutivibrio sulfodismutans TaxID=63561 RepID=A0A7K3NN53_9BACT|nr:[protein-PII] uridylyltransferase [Desulfolutivibrio sulfodismutans]NDY57624.1 [protein-PII] uridylyltransferase [Desulfolutivibrio sulfodismutans]QLA14046.1 [protein-PII] uridylyltransferase [Desulfolutivibrio sulfodismutans DSM 3696]
MTIPDHLPQSARAFAASRQALFADLDAGRTGAGFVAALSDLADRYFGERLAEFGRGARGGGEFSLVAVGGYGRRELCPFSDLDVLLLFPGEPPGWAGELARFLFFPLWDLGLEIGHGVRGVDACLDLARSDHQVLASFLDARHLWGDVRVFAELAARMSREVFPERRAAFALWLAEANIGRGRVHGEAGALLEPQLKEGLGGLRDAHQVRWLSHLADLAGGYQSPAAEAFAALSRDAAFLLVVRCHLHRIGNRKSDKLPFEVQEHIAARLGFTEKDGALGVEVFLAELLRRMSRVKNLREALWPGLAVALGALSDRPPEVVGDGVAKGPSGLDFAPGLSDAQAFSRLFLLFGTAVRTGEPLAFSAVRRARELAFRHGDRLCADPAALASLVGILAADASGRVAEALFESGVLSAMLPEFARVGHLVKFDLYHVHPVGRHSLEAVRRLAEAGAFPESRYHALFTSVAHLDRLILGALFHDIGKGLGGEHAEKGAGIARSALARFGVDPETVEEVAFLVREHLFLADTASRRDLSDRDVAAACAARAGTMDRLNMLLLLTYADARATGPSAWTGWKESLVWELYRRTARMLSEGNLFDEHDAGRMLRTRDRVRAAARGIMPEAEVEACLDQMPPRYLIILDVADITRHLGLVARLRQEARDLAVRLPRGRAGAAGEEAAGYAPGAVVLEARPAPGGAGHELTVAAMETPGLFAVLAGVLALHDVNILSAEVFLWGDGTAIYVFGVSDPPDALYAEELWTRVGGAVRYALLGRLALEYRLDQKRRSPLACRQGQPGGPVAVQVENKTSALYTLIEISAPDRLGLLYDIAHVMAGLRLEVRLAKVDTLGERARDVFYVRGADGKKIEDEGQAREIEAALMHRLGC